MGLPYKNLLNIAKDRLLNRNQLAVDRKRYPYMCHPVVPFGRDANGYEGMFLSDPNGDLIAMNSLAGEPTWGHIDGTGTAGADTEEIRPDAGEVWEVDYIAIRHGGAAGRAFSAQLETGVATYVIPINAQSETLAQNTDWVIFPVQYDVTNDWIEQAGKSPIKINNTCYILINVGVDNLESYDINYLYRVIKAAPE